MDILFSHEQGDFDSLGALLGAYLLNKNALPFLQRRFNRNVNSFLSLYRTELPFLDLHDLPSLPVESLLLLDTQSLPTIKGITKATRVSVIDHHPLRNDLPPNWDITIEPVGACTTLLIEKIQQQPTELSAIHATLMLLGIYEDTGSLTYDNTTPRDLQAAAFLLNKGASLRIAAKFLNPPLSPEQQALYDRLLASLQTHSIQGQNIIIACAEATEMRDEISSVAHKLRDLLDPDGLIMLVRTHEGIRIVVRSTSEQVNAAKIAASFGGGGHDRAASALISKTHSRATQSIDAICTEILQRLPHIIEPPITVGQIMSRRPLVLTPQTTAEEAARYMQKYGYEGYPIVRDGKVVGLLTRRAVDRTLAHKMNLTAASLMEAGEVTVFPDHTVEHLQRVMTSSGWGQVPVVDPETRKIIGIVTRTDLFKSMFGSKILPPSKLNLAGRLSAALPPARLALLQTVAQIAHSQQRAVYIVGGFVRDLLLDRPSVDFDIVVEGNAIELANTLAAQFGGKIVSHKRFGTAKWCIADIRHKVIHQFSSTGLLNADELPDCLDLISARREFYDHPTALPTVERGSIKLDLHRRDFTINTMALRLDGRHYGELYDFWGGYGDLKEGIIRVLHSLSFVDDPTRMLRAVRFEQRFGFRIEDRTLQLLYEARHLLTAVSAQRLRHELDLILLEKNASDMLSRLQALGLLSVIHPELKWQKEDSQPLMQALSEKPEPFWSLPQEIGKLPTRLAVAYLIWLHRLPQEKATQVGHRLNFSQKMTSALEAIIRLMQEIGQLKDCPPSQIVHRLETVPPIGLYVVSLLSQQLQEKETIHRYLTEWQHIHPVINGKYLHTMNLKPGPSYQRILNMLRDAWLDQLIQSEEEEKNYLSRLLAEKG